MAARPAWPVAKTQEHQATLVSVLHEAIAGFRVVKAFGMEGRESQDFRDLTRRVFRERMKVIRSRAISGPIIEMVSGYRRRAGIHLCLRFSDAGERTHQLCARLVHALRSGQKNQPCESPGSGEHERGGTCFSNSGYQAHSCRSSARRLLCRACARPSATKASASVTATNGAVLDEVSLEIPAGSIMAIVGASGAGKTTLFNLIPRFYDPTGGVVTIDGQDIRHCTLKSLRDQIGLVTQETFLFNDTVANNIAYGKPGASREEIIDAAKRAHAHEFIAQMPNQYDTIIGESGMKLSGGQRQRLAIARAILKNPPDSLIG